MFDLETESERFGAGVWLLQQFVALLVPLIWVLATAHGKVALISALTSAAGPFSSTTLGALATIVWDVFFVWGAGLLLGFTVQKVFPGAAKTGRLVWIVPSSLYVCLLIWAMWNEPLHTVLTTLFFGKGEEAWAVLLITFPTVSSILYSIGSGVAVRWKWGDVGRAD